MNKDTPYKKQHLLWALIIAYFIAGNRKHMILLIQM